MKLHPSVQALVDEIDAFLERSGLSPTAFGVMALNDGSFLRRLRNGETSPAMLTAERVRAFMASYRVTA